MHNKTLRKILKLTESGKIKWFPKKNFDCNGYLHRWGNNWQQRFKEYGIKYESCEEDNEEENIFFTNSFFGYKIEIFLNDLGFLFNTDCNYSTIVLNFYYDDNGAKVLCKSIIEESEIISKLFDVVKKTNIKNIFKKMKDVDYKNKKGFDNIVYLIDSQ